MPTGLIEPHGGELKNLLAPASRLDELKREALDLPVWRLSERQLCDVELLLNGGFSPLGGFMTQSEYESVCANMRLTDGALWPIPIVLDVSERFCSDGGVEENSKIALADAEGARIAILRVSSVWRPDKAAEARAVYGADDVGHGGVATLLNRTNPIYLGGELTGLEAPRHYSFIDLRRSPAQTRARFKQIGARDIVAFQTRNPLHRAHVELTKRAMRATDAHLLIHPVVGVSKSDDVDAAVRVKCYQAVLPRYPADSVTLSLLPLAMRMAGPREAVWHAIIRKNFGCNRFIVGRDHAGPGADKSGKPYYDEYDAQKLLARHADELGIEIAPFEAVVYVKNKRKYMPLSETAASDEVVNLSGSKLRELLAEGAEIPNWFSYPEVIAILRGAYPPKRERGVTVFMTGLPSAGKSTIANTLIHKLADRTERKITLLDGDIARKMLSSELTFSKEHRDLNIRRIAFVANEITKNGGVAVCAPIAPYTAARAEARRMISANGGFFEVFVDAPIAVCEARDRKGLYAKARKGVISGVTGVDDPYEPPQAPDIRLDSARLTAEQAADAIVNQLKSSGYID